MESKILKKFAYECRTYLSSLSIEKLRSYGRIVGVDCPTKKKKKELSDEIVAVLTGELQPVNRNLRGAPVKNDYVDPAIPETIEKIRARIQLEARKLEEKNAPPARSIAEEIAEFREKNRRQIVVNDPYAVRGRGGAVDGLPIRTGQLETLDKVTCLLPLNCRNNGEKIIMPVEFIREYDLKEGDILSCRVQEGQNAYVVAKVLTINQRKVGEHRRLGDFDDLLASYPKQPVRFYREERGGSVAAKYLDWTFALGRGQRCRIVSPPKAGKTELLYDLVKGSLTADPETTTLVLLVGRSPEEIGRFRKLVDDEHLVYSTYEDEPERQVFTAEFLLKRAKRLAECGTNVLLFVDSLNALACAFNDTTASLGGKTLAGGLEVKTLQYIKKYFGAARNFEKGGSITMIGTVTSGSGDPVDEYISTELKSISNAEIVLDEDLARKRLYPAVDLSQTKTWNGVDKYGNEENLRLLLSKEYLPKVGAEALYKALAETTAYEAFVARLLSDVEAQQKQ